MEKPSDELANMIWERLYDPGRFVERGNHETRKDRPEPLDLWKLRSIMTAFEEVVRREKDGKVTVLARTAWRDPNSELDGE